MHCLCKLGLIIFLFASVLYGISYQQYHHFDLNDTRGLSDIKSYISMSYGNYNVSKTHKYRFLIPYLAGLIRQPITIFIEDASERDKLSFYAINYCMTLAAGILLLYIFVGLGFSEYLAIIGGLLFFTSRAVVISASVPLVDSLYYLAICIILYCIVTNRVWLLAILLPLLVISKENIFPIILFPLFEKKFRCSPFIISLSISIVVFFGVRVIINEGSAFGVESLYQVILEHIVRVSSHVKMLFTLKGLHMVGNSFAFIIVLSGVGFFINRRCKYYKIPSYYMYLIVLSIAFAILSGNFGRMLYSSYIPVITYCLIIIKHVIEHADAVPG